MERYFRTFYKGTIPSIRGHRFHPWLFKGTNEEYNKIIDELDGREDEYKITGWLSFDTYEDYCKEFPITSKLMEDK